MHDIEANMKQSLADTGWCTRVNKQDTPTHRATVQSGGEKRTQHIFTTSIWVCDSWKLLFCLVHIHTSNTTLKYHFTAREQEHIYWLYWRPRSFGLNFCSTLTFWPFWHALIAHSEMDGSWQTGTSLSNRVGAFWTKKTTTTKKTQRNKHAAALPVKSVIWLITQ